MLQAMTITETLALFLGLYCVAAGIGLVADWKSFTKIIDELQEYSILGFFAGIITFTLGAVIVTLHNSWTDPLSIIVSLFGWGALIEGFFLLALRRPFLRLVSFFPLTVKTMIPYGIFAILLGLVMIYGALG